MAITDWVIGSNGGLLVVMVVMDWVIGSNGLGYGSNGSNGLGYW